MHILLRLSTFEPVLVFMTILGHTRLVGKSGKIMRGMDERPGKVWVQMDTGVRELPVLCAAEDVMLQFSVFAQEQVRWDDTLCAGTRCT